MSTKINLRSGVWYGDREIEVEFPDGWEVDVVRPDFPSPFSGQEIEAILDAPTGRQTIQELCRGKKHPLIIVDDLNRPTPASVVMPSVMRRLAEVGIPPEDVSILMATGTHGLPSLEALYKKAGPAAAKSRLLIHNCFKDAVRVGKTQAGTPIYLNRALLEADVVLGIGGIYPNHTAGFGGGTKLILGVLGIRSIYALHFGNSAQGWGENGIDQTFRRELDEIAEKAGLGFVISAIIDGDRNLIQMYCGDPRRYFPEAVAYYRRVYETRGVDGADVVIANTYPNDLSLTFARMKGFSPLAACGEGITKIAIAACDEGLGLHNIWPFVNVPRLHRWKHIRRVLAVKPGQAIIARGLSYLRRKLSPLRKKPDSEKTSNPVWLYRSSGRAEDFQIPISGIRVTDNWPEILAAAWEEHPGVKQLKVRVYPFSFLQLIHDPQEKDSIAAGIGDVFEPIPESHGS
ncbi:MAG: lactate racemase domain-containing protein [Anaerolineaceae bacterium]